MIFFAVVVMIFDRIASGCRRFVSTCITQAMELLLFRAGVNIIDKIWRAYG